MSSVFLPPIAPLIAIWQIFWVLMWTTSLASLSAFFLRCSAPSHMTDSGSNAIWRSYSRRRDVSRLAIALKRSFLTWVIALLFISTLYSSDSSSNDIGSNAGLIGRPSTVP